MFGRKRARVARIIRAIEPRRSRKGDAGRVGVIGGSAQYVGAPYYAGKGALAVGADLVFLKTHESCSHAIKVNPFFL